MIEVKRHKTPLQNPSKLDRSNGNVLLKSPINVGQAAWSERLCVEE